MAVIDQSIRREKYKLLKESGFTSREATKYKDRSWEIVRALVKAKQENKTMFDEIVKPILNKE